jgi:hypothetical protein
LKLRACRTPETPAAPAEKKTPRRKQSDWQMQERVKELEAKNLGAWGMWLAQNIVWLQNIFVDICWWFVNWHIDILFIFDQQLEMINVGTDGSGSPQNCQTSEGHKQWKRPSGWWLILGHNQVGWDWESWDSTRKWWGISPDYIYIYKYTYLKMQVASDIPEWTWGYFINTNADLTWFHNGWRSRNDGWGQLEPSPVHEIFPFCS